MIEIREVLRAWLAGEGLRTVAARAGVDRKTAVTSDREPSEWIAMMADPLLAQSAIDRLVSATHELVVEGESYRRRQQPSHQHGPRATSGVSVDES